MVPGIHTEYTVQSYDNSDGLQRSSGAESIRGFSFGARWPGLTLTYTYAQSSLLNLVPFVTLAASASQVVNAHDLRLDALDGICDVRMSLKLFPGGTWTDLQGAVHSFRAHDYRVEASVHDTGSRDLFMQMGGAFLLGYRTFQVPRTLATSDSLFNSKLASLPVVTDASHFFYLGMGKPLRRDPAGFYATWEFFVTAGTGPSPEGTRSKFFNDTTDLRSDGNEFDLGLRIALEAGVSGHLGQAALGMRASVRMEADILWAGLSGTRSGVDWDKASGTEKVADTFFDVNYSSSPTALSAVFEAWVGF
jgi:hypothetical protein